MKIQQSMSDEALLEHKMTNVFFIIDGHKLEAQAYFLVASILDHMTQGCRFFAYVRPGTVLPPSLNMLLESASVQIREIPGISPDPWSAPYPIGNKLLAAADDRGGEVSVFLDTDVIFCERVDFSPLLQEAAVGAVLSDYKLGGVRDSAEWQKIFDFFKVEMPVARSAPLKRPKADYLPYFNSGLVIFKERTPFHERRVGEEWLKMSLEFDHGFDLVKWRIPRGKIDQVALAVLGAKLGVSTHILPQRFNYNVMGWGAPAEGNCAIAHYHTLGRLWGSQNIGRPAITSLRKHLGSNEFGKFVAEYRPHLYWRRAKHLLV